MPFRRRPFANIAIAVLVLGGSLFLGARGAGPVPPLGPLLDPGGALWGARAARAERRQASGHIPGLGAESRIVYDDRGVPHIFAASEEDAYRALGWAVARDRLFQLEIQAAAAAGRLTELVGPAGLSSDMQTRALGMPRAAERLMASLDPNAASTRALYAYTEGVNAYIATLGARERPPEYALLGMRPRPWEPINTLHLVNRLGWTLGHNRHALDRQLVRARVGTTAADALFSPAAPIQEPVQPSGRAMPAMRQASFPPPGAPDTGLIALLEGAWGGVAGLPDDAGAVGSNAWTIAPSRTASGRAQLAADPHLELTLPSIWYEVHVVVPGRLDVYGVTIPGAPVVLIGFNRDVAWTFTAMYADVLDHYLEEVDDPHAPRRYRLDGAWRDLELRVERYLGPGGALLATDTTRYTHRGPLRSFGDRWISTRWGVLELDDPVRPFLHGMRAGSAREWLDIMADHRAPPLNMHAADRHGRIGVRSTARIPIRPGGGRGDILQDGTRSASDWTGFWPIADYPQSMDPAQGYLASANQQPLDPAVQPRYLGANWPAPWRALRLNALLRGDTSVTMDASRRWQTDPHSARAGVFVPAFLDAARGRSNERLARAAELLEAWDHGYGPDDVRAVLFENAMRELRIRLWDELREEEEEAGVVAPGGRQAGEGRPRRPARPAPVPSEDVTAVLLRDPESPWWDVRRTSEREMRDDVLAASLEAALERTTGALGEPDDGRWRWGSVRPQQIRHLMGFDGWSVLNMPVHGGQATLNPVPEGGGFGASWRMVVELGDEVRALGNYPGGQSGRPGSGGYLDRMERWRVGGLDTLRFPRSAEALPAAQVRSMVRLLP